MAWLCTFGNGEEYICEEKPIRGKSIYSPKYNYWYVDSYHRVKLPKGFIKKIIGRELTWNDETVELKEN